METSIAQKKTLFVVVLFDGTTVVDAVDTHQIRTQAQLVIVECPDGTLKVEKHRTDQQIQGSFVSHLRAEELVIDAVNQVRFRPVGL